MIHIDEKVLDNLGNIDPNKIDLVGRLGGNWYCRASNEAIFEVEKPLRTLGIGIDQIPSEIRNSSILSGNDLGKLGNIERIPSSDEVEHYRQKNIKVDEILNFNIEDQEARDALHLKAKELLSKGKTLDAWKTLLIDKINRT